MSDFRISTISNPDVYEKLSLTLDIEKQLNKSLHLSNYTDKIDRIFFVYVITQTGTSIPRPDSGNYQWKQRKFTIYRNIDYHQFRSASYHEALHLLAYNYLQTIELYLLNRKDFAGEKFYTDLYNFFTEEGWLEHKTIKN